MFKPSVSRRRAPFSVASAAGLALLTLGCEVNSAPVIDSAPDLAARGAVVQSVTGSGHFTQGGEFRNFSFTARKHADGSVSGQFEATARIADIRAHGRITCMTVIGNNVWLAGPTTHFRPPPGFPFGLPFDTRWQVVDNGAGANSPPDQISLSFPIPPGGSAAFCANTPALGLNDVEAGNITIQQ